MSEGRLGVATTIAGDVDVGVAVPSGRTETSNLILSHNGVDATVKVYARDGTKADEDLIWPSTLMSSSINSRIEITNIVMSAGEFLTVESDVAGIICRRHGFQSAEVT